MRDPGFVETFNRIADTYDERHGATCAAAHRLALAAVTARGITPRRIVDVGCGTGALLELAAQTWPAARLAGVDPARRMVQLARRRLPAADLHVGQAERLPFPDNSADLVLSTTSFNHWTDHRGGLREASRVCVPDGLVVLVEHAVPGPLLGTMLRLTGRMVRHHSETEFAEMAWDGGLGPLSVTTQHEGFVRLLGRPSAADLWRETS